MISTIKKLVTSQVYDVTKLVSTQNTRGKIFISIFFFCSCYSHLLDHICDIAGFAGTKLRVEIGNFSQGGTSQFAEVFFKIKNTISHSIFVISTKFFRVSTPLDVLFRTHYKNMHIRNFKSGEKHDVIIVTSDI